MILLDRSLWRILKQTVFTYIMTTRKEYDWVVIRWYHKFKTDTTNVRLDLISDFFIELLGLFIVIFCKRIVHLLDQIGSIVLYTILNIQLLFYLISLSLFVPFFPFLLMQSQLFLFTHFIL